MKKLLLITLLLSPLAYGDQVKIVAVDASGKEGEPIEVDQSVAELSNTIKDMISDIGATGIIPVQGISQQDLKAVFELAKKAQDSHLVPSKEESQVRAHVNTLGLSQLNVPKLVDLLNGASYLNISLLFDPIAFAIASKVNWDQWGKESQNTPDKIRMSVKENALRKLVDGYITLKWAKFFN